MSELNAVDIERSLEKMAEMLALDGYNVDVDVDGDRVALTVVAGPDACKECLVPKEILVSIATDMLEQRDIQVDPSRLEIIYPLDQECH